MYKNFILPTSLLVGTIIGGGIFSLPFVFAKAGFISGVLYLILLGAVSTIIHLMYADVIIRTNNDAHRFPGYAEMYLGKTGGWLANITVFTSFTLTLLVYLILSISFINLIYPSIPGIFKILIFWALGSMAIFLNIKRAALFDSITSFITILIIGLILFFGLPGYLDKTPQIIMMDLKSLFFPLGPVLFSLLGMSAVPPLVVYFKELNLDTAKIKKIINAGTIITMLAYLAFVIGIIGLSPKITDDAVSGLIGFVPPFLLFIIGIFGFASLWDSYASIGTDIKKILRHDWNLPKITVDSIVVFLPLALYFLGLQNFIKLISVIGGVLFSIWGILLVSIWRKACQMDTDKFIIKKINPLVIYLLILIFISAIIYQIKYIF